MKFKNLIHGVLLPDDFVLFLKKNNIYENYINNLNNIKSRNFNKSIIRKDLIMDAFKWKDSNEGSSFWCNVYYKWNSENGIQQ